MKKTNQILVVCAIVMAAIFASCEQKCKKCSNEVSFDPENVDGYFVYPADSTRPDVALNYDQVVSMLKEYDATRIAPLEEALKYPDSRINTYDFKKFIQYLNYVEKLTKGIKGKKVEITGISFISAAKTNYNNTGRSYQDLIYIPTTTIDGKQIPFDAYLSNKRDSLVTFKQALAEKGYKWIYDSKEDYENGVAKDHNYSLPVLKQKSANSSPQFEKSGAGNFGSLSPPL